MKRGRKDSSQYAVSLFPFLAVLICTMGILVVLLVVAVRAADFEAQKTTQAKRAGIQEKIDAIQDSLNEEDLRHDGLKEFRPDLIARLRDARARRAHVQTTLDNLDKQAEQLVQKQTLLERQSQEESLMNLSQLEAEADLLSQQIAFATVQVEELKDTPPVETRSYSIVPSNSGTSTGRRPIYIECFENKLVLRPQQVTLTVDDFRQPVGPGNPLDAALIAIRDYWQRYEIDGPEGDPYPLLVVRPSGARAYALARHAMQSWQDEFGYELVDETLMLEFGEPDPQLQDEINAAVTKAKQRAQPFRSQAIAQGGGFGSQTGASGESSSGYRAKRRSGQYAGLTVDSKNGGFSFEGTAAEQAVFDSYDNRTETGGSETTAGDNFEFSQQTNWESHHDGTASASQVSSAATDFDGNSHSQNSTQSAGAGVVGGSAVGNSLDSIANSRGQDWALPSRTEGGTVYRRPITVYCTAEKLVVESKTSLSDTQTVVAINGQTETAIDPFVSAIWEKIDLWGFAGTGGYWKPELKINVLPGGLQRARDLRILLQGSGLDVELIEL